MHIPVLCVHDIRTTRTPEVKTGWRCSLSLPGTQFERRSDLSCWQLALQYRFQKCESHRCRAKKGDVGCFHSRFEGTSCVVTGPITTPQAGSHVRSITFHKRLHRTVSQPLLSSPLGLSQHPSNDQEPHHSLRTPQLCLPPLNAKKKRISAACSPSPVILSDKQ